MEEQLERYLDRVFGEHKGCNESNVEVCTKKEEWELDPKKKLKINNLIGQGAYGSVYKGFYEGKEVAVKILDLSNEKRRGYSNKGIHARSFYMTSPTIYTSRRPEIPNSFPSALANIMKQCWDANPKKSPEMQEVVLRLEAIDTSEVAQNESHGCFCLTRRKDYNLLETDFDQ
ncbi:hypothetical protein RND71_005945 [Anisodus tanguticus]|uniref:Uncharacterized protein n=1 Tax=Anisodus tanguticus TaxID=243964 RepID=A0AAE1SPZ3_9SOLA|nr:hypothetical protein RND71_005945 [Anisodus tanguticus]